MAITQICGFETGDATEGALTGTSSIQTGTVRSGTYALRCNPTTTATGYFTLQNPSASGLGSGGSQRYRFYFSYATKPASVSEEIFVSQAGVCFTTFAVRINSAGNLSAWTNNTTQLGSNGTTVLAANTWYRIEVKAVSGAWAVSIDGTTEISGADTGGWNGASSARFGKGTNRNGNTVDFFYDDIVFDSATFPIGAGQCTLLTPNANGNYQTWTIGAGAGSHFQVADEVPTNTTDYLLSTLVSGDAETEALTDSSTAGITGTVNAVKAFSLVIRDGASNGAVRLRLRSGSTDSDTSADFSTNAGYVGLGKVVATDPATGSAWTLSGLDGIETGAVEKSATQRSRMTFTGVMVDYIPGSPPPPTTSYSNLSLMGVG